MGIQTKCKKCGAVSPLRTDICDRCGSMSFVPFDNGETRKISEIVDALAAKEREEKAAVSVKKESESSTESEPKETVSKKVKK